MAEVDNRQILHPEYVRRNTRCFDLKQMNHSVNLFANTPFNGNLTNQKCSTSAVMHIFQTNPPLSDMVEMNVASERMIFPERLLNQELHLKNEKKLKRSTQGGFVEGSSPSQGELRPPLQPRCFLFRAFICVDLVSAIPTVHYQTGCSFKKFYPNSAWSSIR